MKSNLLAISSALAALAAFALLPASPVAAGVIFVVSAILAVFVADYGRTSKPYVLAGDVVPFDSNCAVSDCVRQAA